MAQTSPLFDRIGAALGQDSQVAVNRVAELFVDALLADKRVSHFFKKRGTTRERHMKHISMFVAMAFGKNSAYNFSQEGVANLTHAHEGLKITSTHFNIVCSHLKACLEKVQLPPRLIRECMVIIGCTMTAIVQEDDEDEETSSNDGDSISLTGQKIC